MNRITEITRRDIVDALTIEKISWSGRLEETEFLSRLYDLKTLPSFDGRFKDAQGDIWQHRINNYDWDDEWIFSDSRFGLKDGDDELLLRFLCEMLHPVVRPDVTESERLAQMINGYLKNDGYQVVEKTRISGRPVYSARYDGVAQTPVVATARRLLAGTDPGYIAQQITRLEAAVQNDPDLAIGTAKELVETCCHTILQERGQAVPKDIDMPKLVKFTAKTLSLTPDDIPDNAKASEIIKRLLSNLATVSQALAELRNQYGTGHGKVASSKGLSSRHARLAVGAASTLAIFLVETHKVRQ